MEHFVWMVLGSLCSCCGAQQHKQPSPFTTHCTLHTAHCTLQTAHCTLYTIHWKLHTVHCTLNNAQFTQHTELCTQKSTQYILHSTHYTLHTAHCIYWGGKLPIQCGGSIAAFSHQPPYIHTDILTVHCACTASRCTLHTAHCAHYTVECVNITIYPLFSFCKYRTTAVFYWIHFYSSPTHISYICSLYWQCIATELDHCTGPIHSESRNVCLLFVVVVCRAIA